MADVSTVQIALIAASASVVGGAVGAVGPMWVAAKSARAQLEGAKAQRTQAAREKRSDALITAATESISAVAAVFVAANDVITIGPWQVDNGDGTFEVDAERADVLRFRDTYQAAVIAIEAVRLRASTEPVKTASAVLREELGGLVDVVDSEQEQGSPTIEAISPELRKRLRELVDAAETEASELLREP
jgi:hypothetical protein